MTSYRRSPLPIKMSLNYTMFWLFLAGLATAKDIPRMPAETLSSPTVSFASAITPAPYLHKDLFKRVIATCGFVRGDSGTFYLHSTCIFDHWQLTFITAAPVTCSEGYNCVQAGKYSQGFACCNEVECLADWGICRPYGQKGCMGNSLEDDVCASIYGPILQWSVFMLS
jgi:hypothetical protein